MFIDISWLVNHILYCSNNFVHISISIAPPVECTYDLTFNRTRYVDRERGLRHLDGFVDCNAELNGRGYYVEDYNITRELKTFLGSCFAPDGLCFPLKHISYGGWMYFIFDVTGNNSSL